MRRTKQDSQVLRNIKVNIYNTIETGKSEFGIGKSEFGETMNTLTLYNYALNINP